MILDSCNRRLALRYNPIEIIVTDDVSTPANVAKICFIESATVKNKVSEILNMIFTLTFCASTGDVVCEMVLGVLVVVEVVEVVVVV